MNKHLGRVLVVVSVIGWVTLLIVSASRAGTPTVTRWEFNHVHVHDTKRHVQDVFDTKGDTVVDWYGEAGVEHLWKNYPTNVDGKTVQIVYIRRLQARHFHLDHKCWTSTPSTPCRTP